MSKTTDFSPKTMWKGRDFSDQVKLLILSILLSLVVVIQPLNPNLASASGSPLRFQSVAAGDYFSLALSTDGNIYSWGDNAKGQLGDGTTNSRTSPGPVSTVNFGSLTFSAIAAGTDFALALRVDGTVFAWGNNFNGQLGDGTGANKSLPTQLASALTFSHISAGSNFSIALTETGKAYSWGANQNGQLGDNSTTMRTSPVEVSGGLTFSQVSAGLNHVVAISSDGLLYSWGLETYGRLGQGNPLVGAITPGAVVTTLVGSRTFSAVAAGSLWSIALDSNGTAFSWGSNYNGVLGIGVTGTTSDSESEPVAVDSNLSFSAITAGRFHSVATNRSGQLYAWGDHQEGKIGDGTSTLRNSPTGASTQSSGLATFSAVSAGVGIQANHTLALSSEGVLYSWGWNAYGQLGNSTTTSVNVPTALPDYYIRPTANLTNATSEPSAANVLLTCSASCGPADDYAYVATLSFNGQSVANKNGTATSATTSLSFTGLQANTSYTLEVSVTYNGVTSSTETSTITTLRPAATISALSIADTSATLTVGCSNCGTAPDSFSISATPTSGGPAIHSNTNVISGLTPETTYSFSVVVAFAGTTSDVMLWQDNPVMTLPPAPQTPTTPGSAPPVVPMITEFSTKEISATGAEVTVTGRRLENLSALTLGGITVTIVANTATSITFTTGEMPVGVWDLRLVGPYGTLVFHQAIEVVAATAIVGESTGELLGWTWTLKFLGNSRSLHLAQSEHLASKLDEYPTAETIICWGYTTAENPNAWAIAHATQRAQAACDLASANNPEVKTVVRLRYGVSKNWAMRSALQFWEQKSTP